MTVMAGVSFAEAKPSALELTAQTGDGAKAFNLKGKHARQQLVATAKDTGKDVDVTRTAKYAVAPANVVAVTPTGLVTPLGDGEATITAIIDGVKSEVKVTVTEYGVVQPINFANEIVPIFTKAGCNGGGCHGKSGGQNGFRLSLLGFEPRLRVPRERGPRPAPEPGVPRQQPVAPQGRGHSAARRWRAV